MNLTIIRKSFALLANNATWPHHITTFIGRLYVANVFFSAGLLKIKDWGTTQFLFEEEYSVPLLSPGVAAVLGTAGELILPILLVLGLGSRFAAIGLFIVNAVAVISLSEIAPAALYLHGIWGLLLAQVALYSSGLFSIDNLLKLEPCENNKK